GRPDRHGARRDRRRASQRRARRTAGRCPAARGRLWLARPRAPRAALTAGRPRAALVRNGGSALGASPRRRTRQGSLLRDRNRLRLALDACSGRVQLELVEDRGADLGRLPRALLLARHGGPATFVDELPLAIGAVDRLELGQLRFGIGRGQELLDA